MLGKRFEPPLSTSQNLEIIVGFIWAMLNPGSTHAKLVFVCIALKFEKNWGECVWWTLHTTYEVT